jgi:hypothetical protein
MMTRLLLKPVEITVSGETKKVTALEAILLQLRGRSFQTTYERRVSGHLGMMLA